MKNRASYIKLLVLAALLAAPQARAGAPLKLNFQGRLDQSGQPAEGSKTFLFKIYDAVSGGNLKWTSSSQAIDVSGGLFSAVLSTGTPADLSTATFSGARFIEITVDGVPLSPRQELVSAPYALVAQALAPDAELPPAVIADGSVTDAKVLLTTAAISSGKFGDDRVAITAAAITGTFGDSSVAITTGAVTSGKFGDDRVAISTGVISGLGTLAQSNSEADPVFTAAPAYVITASSVTNWNAAYGWGNHAGLYLAAPATFTYVASEADPVFAAAPAYVITASSVTNWDAAYGWGNHASAGYATTTQVNTALASYAALSATQTFTGVNTFSSTAAFTAQFGSQPGVTISSGLVVSAGSVGVGTASPNSVLTVNGSMSLPIKTITITNSPYAVTGADGTILVNAASSGAELFLDLPDAAGVKGRIYTMKRLDDPAAIGAFPVTIRASGVQTIDGLATLQLVAMQWVSVVIQSTGSNWVILSVYDVAI